MKTKNKFETKNDKYETALTNKSRKEQRFRIGNYSSIWVSMPPSVDHLMQSS